MIALTDIKNEIKEESNFLNFEKLLRVIIPQSSIIVSPSCNDQDFIYHSELKEKLVILCFGYVKKELCRIAFRNELIKNIQDNNITNPGKILEKFIDEIQNEADGLTILTFNLNQGIILIAAHNCSVWTLLNTEDSSILSKSTLRLLERNNAKEDLVNKKTIIKKINFTTNVEELGLGNYLTLLVEFNSVIQELDEDINEKVQIQFNDLNPIGTIIEKLGKKNVIGIKLKA